MPRIGKVIREVYHRPGPGALSAHLEDHYGIRVTGTARLAEGVFRVDHDAGPPWVARLMLTSRECITALAAAVRAHCGGPA